MGSPIAEYSEMEIAADQAVLTARRWTELSSHYPHGQAAQLLAQVLEDSAGLNFTVEFVDGVVRPEDMRVAAHNLTQLTKKAPAFLPAWLRIPAKVGGTVGFLAPEIVVPAARKVFSQLVGDLVLDVSDNKLGPAIGRLREDGSRLNINLLGEAVLGDKEADRRLQDTFELLSRDDVDYVSLKVSAVVGPHSPWSHQQVVAQAVERLLPFYHYAAASENPKFINLDMEEYRDLDLTLDVFETLLDRSELMELEAGIVVQAYLPDALAAMQRLQDWAAQRTAKGGAPIKVRLVKGANLAMEKVEAELHGWPVATWESKRATDANYLRILDWALTPQRCANVRVGVAGHNLFTLATAWELAGIRGVRNSIDVEMLAGMATPQAEAIRQDVGDLLLYVPVVRPKEFDSAIAYLVRRLEENSASDNFMSSIFDIATDSRVFDREKDRFLQAFKQMVGEGDIRCHPSRTQNRLTETADSLEAENRSAGGGWFFRNAADTDPSLAANRQWVEEIIDRVPTSTVGEDTVKDNLVETHSALDKRLKRALKAGKKWREKPANERADVLHRVGVELAVARGKMLEVAAAELGKNIEQSDPEISEAIDFAHYYAEQAYELEQIHGADFVPGELTVVTPPWNFPLSIPLGGVTAALAAGTPVILKPATVARRCAAVLAECLWAAGVDADLCQLLIPSNREIGKALVEDSRVDRVILTGSAETAQLFRRWRPGLNLLAETSGKNSIIVTPSADLDLAVRDVVASAFGHAGQKCSAASLVILVGSTAFSRRFHGQLLDAARSLVTDWPTNLASEMGPLSEVPGEKLLRGLTRLESGQSWAIQPEQRDDSGRLWSPGVRAGVRPHSEFHRVEYFGPLLGVVRAATLEEAIEIQNGTDFGLTAGLQSLATDEITYWLDRVQAGNVYINRSITGAIVRRQPFGGWKLSAVGPGAKAGGPNYLFGFGSFTPSPYQENRAGGEGFPEVPARNLHLTKTPLIELIDVAKQVLSPEDAQQVARAAYNAQRACETEFDRLSDPSRLQCERNVLRYLPTNAILRAEEGTPLLDILTIAPAAVAVGEFRPTANSEGPQARFFPGQVGQNLTAEVEIVFSTPKSLPTHVREWARKYGITCVTESRTDFEERLATSDFAYDGRVRLLGGSRHDLQEALEGAIDVSIWDGPATTAGRVEIIPFVHEQAVSFPTHRFGTPSSVTKSVLVEE